MPNFSKLQNEVGEWSEENFPGQPHENPYLGIFEEGGELVHSVLKQRQGIREDDEDVGLDAELDSVGDIVVYTADHCARVGVDMQESYDQTGPLHADDEVEAIQEFAAAYGRVTNLELADRRVSEVYVGQMVQALDAFCQHKPFTLEEAIDFAWYDEVVDREWDSSYKEE